MPRGKYVNHKGRSRHFTSPEELQQESEEESDQSSSGSEKGEQSGTATGATGTSKQPAAVRKPVKSVQRQKQQRQQQRRSSSDEESDDDEGSDDDSEADDRDAKKGVASLIEIENPNRVTKKATQKLSQIKIDDTTGGSGSVSASSKPELSRREREQLEKQKARQRYEKLHAAGKTTEAKADLARLALIRQQREEAAAKREAEKKSIADLPKKPGSK